MDYRYLTETKNEFFNFLNGILVPHIYHGIKGILKFSEKTHNLFESRKKQGAHIPSPGITAIFVKTLDGISSLNDYEIEEEYQNIKSISGCGDWFDSLVRACFKSYVLFLTWDPKTSNSKYSDNTLYDSIVIKNFIHKCYAISCNYFRDNPHFFMSKSNKKDVYDIIKSCVDMSIKKSLPYNQIIQEYLSIDFSQVNQPSKQDIQTMRKMVYDVMNKSKYGTRPQVKSLLVESDNDSDNMNYDARDGHGSHDEFMLENFIENEKIKHDSGAESNDVEDNDQYEQKQDIQVEQEILSPIISTDTIKSRSEIIREEVKDILGTGSGSDKSKDENIEEPKDNIEMSGEQSFNQTVSEILTSPPLIKKPKDVLFSDIEQFKYEIKRPAHKRKVTVDKKSNDFSKIDEFYDELVG